MRPLIVQAQTQKATTHYNEILIGTASLKDTAKHGYIIYSYKYLKSDLIKHCHVIFIHSLSQPLIVRLETEAIMITIHRTKEKRNKTTEN